MKRSVDDAKNPVSYHPGMLKQAANGSLAGELSPSHITRLLMPLTLRADRNRTF